MEISVDVPGYDPARGINLQWDEGFEIRVNVNANEVVIAANAAGLRSLARHLLTMQQAEVPTHAHVHLDASNALEDGSAELILEKL